MHLLEIAATQPGFGNHLGTHRARTPFCSRASLSSSRPFYCGIENGFFSAWKRFGVGKDLNFNFGRGHDRPCGAKLLIKAVVTLEPKRLVHKSNADEHLGLRNSQLVIDNTKSASVQRPLLNRNWEDLDEKEILRRMRISKANKGIVPWNKGKKHRPETVQRIRERTRLAMQDPKVKMKLVKLGHAQSPETRMKIGVSVRLGWQRRRKKLHLQETCYFEWQNLIAEASRKGFDGEGELQWDSYETLKEKLKEEWLESIERRKAMPRAKGSKRAPKSFEQRRKISEAISRKWADSEYRDRVISALAKYHGIEPGAERKKSRTKPSDGCQASRRASVKKDATSIANRYSRIRTEFQTPRPKLIKRRAPSYKDPMASSKLEMIKSIRAQRVSTSVEIKKTEAIERAKLLIAEAERAAKALEAAAKKSPIARASLIESRKLIAEAVRSIESIETVPISSSHENNDDSDGAREVPTEASMVKVKVNGTRLVEPSSKKDDAGFSNGKSNLHDVLDFDGGLFPVSSTGSEFSYETLTKQSNSVDLTRGGQMQEKPVVNGAAKVAVPGEEVADVGTLTERATVNAVAITKRWVRGRLVEVTEGMV